MKYEISSLAVDILEILSEGLIVVHQLGHAHVGQQVVNLGNHKVLVQQVGETGLHLLESQGDIGVHQTVPEVVGGDVPEGVPVVHLHARQVDRLLEVDDAEAGRVGQTIGEGVASHEAQVDEGFVDHVLLANGHLEASNT